MTLTFTKLDDKEHHYQLVGNFSKEKLNENLVNGNNVINENSDKVFFDLSAIVDTDSTLLAALVAWQRLAVKSKKEIFFLKPSKQIEKIIELSGLNTVLNFS